MWYQRWSTLYILPVYFKAFAQFSEMHWGNHNIVSPTYSKKVIPPSLDLTLYMQRQRFNLGKVEQWWRHRISPGHWALIVNMIHWTKRINGIFNFSVVMFEVSMQKVSRLEGFLFRLCEVAVSQWSFPPGLHPLDCDFWFFLPTSLGETTPRVQWDVELPRVASACRAPQAAGIPWKFSPPGETWITRSLP